MRDTSHVVGKKFVVDAFMQMQKWKENSCCGKVICSGCIYAGVMVGDDKLCPFCRAPTPSSKASIKLTKKCIDVGNAQSIYNVGCCYAEGTYGLQHDWGKALELWYQSAELGHTLAYHNIGNSYLNGRGVERDTKKAIHYWELATMGGDAMARYNLGCFEEEDAGNMSRSLKHHMIAAGFGYDRSLKKIRECYVNGYATKDDYAKALRTNQKYIDGIKSAQRDEAAAFDSDKYRYY